MKLCTGASGKNDFHDKVKIMFFNNKTDAPDKYFLGDVDFTMSTIPL